MFESEWQTCTDPETMWRALESRRPLVSARKWRLFALGCCRRAERWLIDRCQFALLEAAEAFADGELTAEGLQRVRAADRVSERLQFAAQHGVQVEWVKENVGEPVDVGRLVNDDAVKAAGLVAECLLGASAVEWEDTLYNCSKEVQRVVFLIPQSAGAAACSEQRPDTDRWWQVSDAAAAVERAAVAALLRDSYGPWLRPPTFKARWRTPDVLGLARGIYAERAFDRMPILADALEEAGCDCIDLIAHCRDDGTHARGCWVVDQILDKK